MDNYYLFFKWQQFFSQELLWMFKVRSVTNSKFFLVTSPPPSISLKDDEWREVEENEEKDLEGLKIRSLRAE